MIPSWPVFELPSPAFDRLQFRVETSPSVCYDSPLGRTASMASNSPRSTGDRFASTLATSAKEGVFFGVSAEFTSGIS